MSDYKFSIKDTVSAEVKIKHSRFIARVSYAENVKEAKEFISKISKMEKNANHNCWAYIINENIFHYSDAGEPSGTAGKPIYNTLCKHNLAKVVGVVTRYFGGVKLGIRGLIDAYSLAIEEALKNAELISLVEMKTWKIKSDYSFAEILKHKCFQHGVEIVKIEYADKVIIECKKEKKDSEEFENYLYELSMQKKIELLQRDEK